MKQIVFLTIYFLFLSSQVEGVLTNENMNGSITPRIINGGNANFEIHSYTLSLRHRGTYFCTAVPISDRNVLTAGHCFTERQYLVYPYEDVTVHSGTLSVLELGTIHRIEDVKVHPEFGAPWASNKVHDIAHVLLKEQSRLLIGQYQRKLDLPKKDIFNGDNGVLTGWGCTNIDTPDVPAEQLQALRMGILDWTYCQDRTRKRLYKEQLCAFGTEGNSCTDGDSGGPLVIRNTIVGIRSWCENIICGNGAPEFFTNVFQEKRFIYSAMGLDPDEPSPNTSPLRSKDKKKKKERKKEQLEESPKKSNWIRRLTCTAK